MKRRDVLLDTGPIVATLDPADQWHARCVRALEELADRCVTSEAVVTEACYFVARGGGRAAVVIDFLLDLEVPVLGLDGAALRHAGRLMDRYADQPMDFADASLVVLADALVATSVLTIDRRGFRAYRSGRGKPFQVYP